LHEGAFLNASSPHTLGGAGGENAEKGPLIDHRGIMAQTHHAVDDELLNDR